MLSSGLLLMSVIESEVMFTFCYILSCFTFFCKGHLNTGSLTFKKANKQQQQKTYQIFLKGKREVYTLCKFIIFWFCFVMSMPFSCFFQWEQDCFVLDSPALPPGAGGGVQRRPLRARPTPFAWKMDAEQGVPEGRL